MKKKILITGATDGIGLATAKMLAAQGHHLLIHGRNAQKLSDVKQLLSEISSADKVETYLADFSNLAEVRHLATSINQQHSQLDALINNAGVFKTSNTLTADGLDVRFMVNTIAPYLLAQSLLQVLGNSGRVINLSSAAQAPVSIQAMLGEESLSDMEAYAQSKLAITMWTKTVAEQLSDSGLFIVALNPGSLLASKMVKEGFGVAGSDLSIGAEILSKMVLDDDVLSHSGDYFDNDAGRFSSPHPAGLDKLKSEQIIEAIETVIARKV